MKEVSEAYKEIYARWVRYVIKNFSGDKSCGVKLEDVLKTVTDLVRGLPLRQSIIDTEMNAMPLSHVIYHDLFYTALLNTGIVHYVKKYTQANGITGFGLERGILDIITNCNGSYGMYAKGGVIIARSNVSIGDRAEGGIFLTFAKDCYSLGKWARSGIFIAPDSKGCVGCDANKGAFFFQRKHENIWIIAEGHEEWKDLVDDRTTESYVKYYQDQYYKPRAVKDERLTTIVKEIRSSVVDYQIISLATELERHSKELVKSVSP